MWIRNFYETQPAVDPSQVPKIENQPSHLKYARKIAACLDDDIENSNIFLKRYQITRVLHVYRKLVIHTSTENSIKESVFGHQRYETSDHEEKLGEWAIYRMMWNFLQNTCMMAFL